MRIQRTFTHGILVLSVGSALAVAQTTSGSTSGAQSGSGSQSSTSQSGSHSGAGGANHGNHSADHGMSSNKGAGMMVGQQDHQFMTKAAQGGLMELEVTRLAQEKASSNEIKEFARKLEQDHSKANDQLKQLAAQKNVELPSDMGHHRAMVDKLRNMSGDQFDKAFMKMQVQHHKKDVNDFQKQTNRAMDSDVRNFASATLPALQEHLRQAQELQGSTRGRSSNNNASGSTSGSGSGSASSGDASSSGNTGGTSNSGGSSSRPQGDNNPTTTK